MHKRQEILEVKKFVFKFILLCFVLVLADFVIGKTLKHYYFKINSGSLFHITFAIDSTNAETLVFGSSRAIHHYVPKVFADELNTTFYNCGEDATGLIYSAALIKAVTARYKPKRILLDILPFEFSFSESDRLSKLLPYQDNPAIYPYILSISPYEKIKLVSQSYPFNSLATSIISRNLSKDKLQKTEGYLELDGTMDSVRPPLSEEEGKIIGQKINIYKDLLSYINQLNIPTYIVISPFYAEVLTSKSEGIAKKYCQTYKNVHFISFINRADYLKNHKLFKDFMHLNNFGASKFSKEICDQIKINEKKERN
ncbi:MAG: hypothetical protein ACTHM5_04160 [Ginsengibacter sp.]